MREIKKPLIFFLYYIIDYVHAVLKLVRIIYIVALTPSLKRRTRLMNKKRKSKGKYNTKAFFLVRWWCFTFSEQKSRYKNSLGNFSEIYYILIFLLWSIHTFPGSKAAWPSKPGFCPLIIRLLHDFALLWLDKEWRKPRSERSWGRCFGISHGQKKQTSIFQRENFLEQ